MSTRMVANLQAGGAAAAVEKLRAAAADCAVPLDLASDGRPIGECVRAALSMGCARLIIAGGDGTIHAALNAMSPALPSAALGIVPLGSGNDLARALDLPLDDPTAAFELARTAPARAADVVHVALADGSTTYMANVCSAGLAGQISAAVGEEEKSRWGAWAYWMAVLGRMLDPPEHDTILELDGHTLRVRAYALSIANGRYVGGGLEIGPAARLDDGRLDVSVLPVQPLGAALLAGLDIVRGKHVESERVLTFRAARLGIRATPALDLTVDGEVRGALDARFEVLPGAIRLVAGPNPAGFSPPDGRAG